MLKNSNQRIIDLKFACAPYSYPLTFRDEGLETIRRVCWEKVGGVLSAEAATAAAATA